MAKYWGEDANQQMMRVANGHNNQLDLSMFVEFVETLLLLGCTPPPAAPTWLPRFDRKFARSGGVAEFDVLGCGLPAPAR